jgi:hypothetical protein
MQAVAISLNHDNTYKIVYINRKVTGSNAGIRSIGGNLLKCKSSIVILVCIFLAAVALAGCTSTNNSSPSPTASPTLAGPTATPVPAIGSTVNVNSMIDLTQVHWYQYQVTPSGTTVDLGRGVTSAGSTMTERWDFNVNYYGQNADEVTGTGNYPSVNDTGATIAFINHTNHKQLLGGNMTVVKNGNVIYQGDITSNLLELNSLLDLTNSSYSGSHAVTYEGTETVTVPMGKYTTTKYLYTGDYNLTIYKDPAVPVPIKVEAVSPSGTIFDVELMGWG